MEALVGVGKAVLNGLLSCAKSAIAEDAALKQNIQRDMVFLTDELAEIHSFLRDTDEGLLKVPRSRVKHVRDLAYDVEDCLEEYSIHLQKPSGWQLVRTVLARQQIAEAMKGLRARVEDMSQRNQRYHLLKTLGNVPSAGAPSSIAAVQISAHEEAMREDSEANLDPDRLVGTETGKTVSSADAARRQKLDLIRLIRSEDVNLTAISLWATSGIAWEKSIIKMAYDGLERKSRFECYAWIRIMHPFNQTEFVQNIIQQFYVNILDAATKTKQKSTPFAQDLCRIWMTNEDHLVDEFKKVLSNKRYLVVLCDLSSIEEWDQIKTYLPPIRKGSRVIVCTEQIKVARLCVGTEIPEHKQFSVDPSLHAFYEKGSHGGAGSIKECSSSNTTGSRTRMETTLAAFKESQLIGREKEKQQIIDMISYLNLYSQQIEVISICGMGGLGKTTLVKHVYQSQQLSAMFEKRAFVTIVRPFNPSEVIGSLAAQLGGEQDVDGGTLSGLLQEKRCLIILDDVSSTEEWHAIAEHFPGSVTTSKVIVTTRQENIAKHCSNEDRNVFELQSLEDNDAHDLFTEKVFGEIIDLDDLYPELIDEARLILLKCRGLPLAIVAIGGLLSIRPRTAMEWRKFNDATISAESDINSEVDNIMTVVRGKRYDYLPYHLKPCFLYSSIFPKGHKIRRRRLVKRWTAEGYSREIHGWLPQSAEEVADNYFMELIDSDVILPSPKSIHSLKGIDSCQVHDILSEISISKSEEENFVFRLEKDYRPNKQGTVRHLLISGNWNGNKSKFENEVNLSRIRSLTVFGKWRHFYLSDKMRLLRVLDLEETTGLVDHHLKHIGNFLHLKFLSLRGCHGIYHLPDSVGNLVHLQTLDVKNTRIIKLPKAIIRLRKLEYLRAGGRGGLVGAHSYDVLGQEERLRNLALNSVGFCVACCCNVLPGVARGLDPCAVVMPSGANKLTALRILGTVNIGRGKSIIQSIGSLTQLKKLRVVGLNQKDREEFCSALANLVNLESLLVHSPGMPDLPWLDGVSSPPKNLQSLKLDVTLVKLPEWIGGVHSLVKLVLRWTKLTEVDATMHVLGKLPNLAILRLLGRSFNVGELCLTFHREEFPSLMVLHLGYTINLGSMEFGEEGAAPKLELLVLEYAISGTRSISGLSSLPSLKEVVIKGPCTEELMGSLRDQISRNLNNPVLKRE